MTLLDRVLATAPVVIGTLAVAGLVHFGTILAYSRESDDDAFARVAALAPIRRKTDLPTDPRTRLPFRDAAMLAVVCRYDLRNAPFRIAVPPFGEGFLSFAFYERRSRAFSGLNLHDDADNATSLELMTEGQKAALDAAETNGADDRSLSIVAPGPEGFALIEAPPEARAVLDQVTCSSARPREADPN